METATATSSPGQGPGKGPTRRFASQTSSLFTELASALRKTMSPTKLQRPPPPPPSSAAASPSINNKINQRSCSSSKSALKCEATTATSKDRQETSVSEEAAAASNDRKGGQCKSFDDAKILKTNDFPGSVLEAGRQKRSHTVATVQMTRLQRLRTMATVAYDPEDEPDDLEGEVVVNHVNHDVTDNAVDLIGDYLVIKDVSTDQQWPKTNDHQRQLHVSPSDGWTFDQLFLVKYLYTYLLHSFHSAGAFLQSNI